ncbi:cellulose biosynthesis protein BcsD [Alcaligenes endophyticus]|uniref:Cellulose synthase n=1 Tax=Alcaligenes endophyticus TaxID=1929088 RepID=A0ABT8EEV6_9BURK|nr:cellulose biosynthesis protein BcsD [Alcaligenes endophyticus]MCX5592351.1 cellulose synthase [Alcaligenes endophyticus]MDN4119794.1 cellulose synthase [Alcaligenes endophyticus]
MSQEKLVLQYFAEKNCSTQWRFFILALADELSQAMSENELRVFMRQIGERAARSLPIGPCATVPDIQAAANKHWEALNWGWVELSEHPSYLQLRHYCSPIWHAFGPSAAAWSPSFLEGVYQHWLSSIGASVALKVSQHSSLTLDQPFVDYHLSA